MDARNQVKQYVDIAWRRKWWLVVPSALGVLVSLAMYSTQPKLYQATTLILVTRQAVPEDIVRSTVTMRIDERMKTLKQQVLSRRYMEQVAREIGFIDQTADEAKIDSACRQVENSIELQWDKRDLAWFRINVIQEDRARAAKIANRLAELFIRQNTEMREAIAKGTVDLASTWVAENGGRLEAQEKRIAAYKQAHMYELPDQEASIVQLMNAGLSRISQLTSDIQRSSDRLAILRENEKSNRATAAALGVASAGDDPNARALAQLERELNDLLVTYTDENPLVRRKRDQIAAFKAAYPATVKTAAGQDDTESPEIRSLGAEIRNLTAERAREQSRVADYQRRLMNIPLRQQELADMTRGYDQLKAEYDENLSKKQQTERSLDLETAKKGEQFQIQDLAHAPVTPFSPDIFLYLLMGLGAGIGLGVGLATILEFLDQSVRGEEQFAALFPDVPILGTIPNLVAKTPVKPRTKGNAKKAAAGAVALAAFLGGLLS